MAKYSDKDIGYALMGRAGVKTYPFPGLDGVECGVRALNEEAIDQVRLDAAAYCKTRAADALWDPEFFDRAIRRYTVLRAILDTKDNSPFFNEHADVLHLDAHILRSLYELYIAHCVAMDPLSYASEQEVDAFIDALGKGETEPGALSLFERSTLERYAISLACRLHVKRQTRK